MPISEYFGGHGTSVMRDMMRRHGKNKGKRVFYATATKRKGMKEHMVELSKTGRTRRAK